MSESSPDGIHKLQVVFKDREKLRKSYLSSAPHGGLIIPTERELAVGEAVEITVQCGDEGAHRIRGAVLWCRMGRDDLARAGIGFFASEVERREQLLGTPPPLEGKSPERLDARYDSALKVTYQTAQDFVVDYTRNISTGGIFVDSKRVPPVGAKILLQLFPPGQENPIELSGEVVWQRPGGGFGIRFTNLTTEVRERLSRLVRTIAIGAPVSVGAPVFEEVTPA